MLGVDKTPHVTNTGLMIIFRGFRGFIALLTMKELSVEIVRPRMRNELLLENF